MDSTEQANTKPNERHYERFAISMPAQMAHAIRDLCEREARSHSEFFREAVRVYLSHRQPSTIESALRQTMPVQASTPKHTLTRAASPLSFVPAVAAATHKADHPFAGFDEWENDAEYNHLLVAGMRDGA